MHERYAYGALVFLALLIPERRLRWLGVAFGIVFTLNLLAAVPPTPAIGRCCRWRACWVSPAPSRCSRSRSATLSLPARDDPAEHAP